MKKIIAIFLSVFFFLSLGNANAANPIVSRSPVVKQPKDSIVQLINSTNYVYNVKYTFVSNYHGPYLGWNTYYPNDSYYYTVSDPYYAVCFEANGYQLGCYSSGVYRIVVPAGKITLEKIN